jgi:hypothetical protein
MGKLRDQLRAFLQNSFKPLTAEEALKVWDKATPNEQREVRPMLAAKMNDLGKLPADKRMELRAHPSSPQSRSTDFAAGRQFNVFA